MILYHYTSIETFHKIIENKTIRLSDLTVTNDSGEGEYLFRLIKEVIYDGDNELTNKEELLAYLKQLFKAVAFCLSEKGDLLSQWRGYADDARGVSIGFKSSELEKIIDENNRIYKEEQITDSIEMKEVNYLGEAIPESLILKITLLFYRLNKIIFSDHQSKTAVTIGGRFKDLDSGLFEEIRSDAEIKNFLLEYLFAVKHPFFKEEKETRILLSHVRHSNNPLNDKFNYAPSKQNTIQHIDLPFLDNQTRLIKEIILGPKNTTPIDVMRMYLEDNKCEGVQVRRSCGTYR